MIDRKKIIKGLKELHGSVETMKLISNAITLLKEQEPVKTKVDAFNHPYCPECKVLLYPTWNYCPHCGKAVKWND